MMNDESLTIPKAASRIGVSPDTVRRWVELEILLPVTKLPPTREGGNEITRIPRSTIDKFMIERTQTTKK